FFEQTSKQLASFGSAEVGRHAALVGVEIDEQTALFGIGPIVGKRTAATREVAGRRLDLDNFRAQVSYHLAAVGGRDTLAAFDDPNCAETTRVFCCTHRITLLRLG